MWVFSCQASHAQAGLWPHSDHASLCWLGVVSLVSQGGVQVMSHRVSRLGYGCTWLTHRWAECGWYYWLVGWSVGLAHARYLMSGLGTHLAQSPQCWAGWLSHSSTHLTSWQCGYHHASCWGQTHTQGWLPTQGSHCCCCIWCAVTVFKYISLFRHCAPTPSLLQILEWRLSGRQRLPTTQV